MYLTFPSCKLDNSPPQCPCDHVDISPDSDIMKRYREAPEQALRRALGLAGQTVDLDMLKVVAFSATTEKGMRSVLLVKYLTRMIVEGYVFPSDSSKASVFGSKRCHWELPLVGIYNLLLSIRNDAQKGSEDAKIVDSVYRDSSRIFEAVLKDLPKLLPAGQHADHLRNTVVKTLAVLAQDPKFRNALLHDEKVMTLLLTCWTHMSVPNRDIVNTFIHQLYDTCDRCAPYITDPERRTRAVHILGVNTLTYKFEEWLTNRKIVDQALQLELQVLLDFTQGSPPYGAALADASVVLNIMTAMQRQRQYGKPEYSQLVYHLGFTIIAILALDPHYTGSSGIETIPPDSIDFAMTALLTDAEMREVVPPPAANTCRRHSGYHAFEDMGYYKYIQEIGHILDTEKPSPERGHSTPVFADACRAQIEKIFLPMSRRVFVRAYDGYAFAKEAYYSWKRLTSTFDMTEAKIRAKWKQDGECVNPWCPRRDDSSVRIKVCTRCRNTTYCSRSCQKKDYKEHKLACLAERVAAVESQAQTETR